VNDFRLIGKLTELARLVRVHGRGNWQKRKGFGTVDLAIGYTGTRLTA
jgi:hypothetical protein